MIPLRCRFFTARVQLKSVQEFLTQSKTSERATFVQRQKRLAVVALDIREGYFVQRQKRLAVVALDIREGYFVRRQKRLVVVALDIREGYFVRRQKRLAVVALDIRESLAAVALAMREGCFFFIFDALEMLYQRFLVDKLESLKQVTLTHSQASGVFLENLESLLDITDR